MPDVIAIDVAKESADLAAVALELARGALDAAGLDVPLDPDTAELDDRWIGPAYAVPSDSGDAAIAWAARHGAWVLDRTYAGKAFAGLLGQAEAGRFAPGATVVFWHTGGVPAVFAPGGAAIADPTPDMEAIT
jgi:1-aminocyclopropane-1-carboxylate deaminase/D-cysteine desulfhydrase-like pyridoxal-dependent ACC family enzyme